MQLITYRNRCQEQWNWEVWRLDKAVRGARSCGSGCQKALATPSPSHVLGGPGDPILPARHLSTPERENARRGGTGRLCVPTSTWDGDVRTGFWRWEWHTCREYHGCHQRGLTLTPGRLGLCSPSESRTEPQRGVTSAVPRAGDGTFPVPARRRFSTSRDPTAFPGRRTTLFTHHT